MILLVSGQPCGDINDPTRNKCGVSLMCLRLWSGVSSACVPFLNRT